VRASERARYPVAGPRNLGRPRGLSLCSKVDRLSATRARDVAVFRLRQVHLPETGWEERKCQGRRCGIGVSVFERASSRSPSRRRVIAAINSPTCQSRWAFGESAREIAIRPRVPSRFSLLPGYFIVIKFSAGEEQRQFFRRKSGSPRDPEETGREGTDGRTDGRRY